MTVILSIETSTPLCSVALHESGNLLGSQHYLIPNGHSTLLPGIIDQLLLNCGIAKNDLTAVAVSAGPGSYTGLRIGAATAKGLCMGLQIPLISISCLDSMFESTRNFLEGALICPMIDARRMEVYCYLRKASGDLVWETSPLVVDENTFSLFSDQQVVLLGTGAQKFRGILPTIRIVEGVYPEASFMGKLAFEKFQHSDFEDLAYFEPDYLKEFRTNIPIK